MTPENPKTFHLEGKTSVQRIGFGAMRLPTNGFHGPPRDPKTGIEVLRRAVELGVDLIDTAAFYHSSDKSVRANALIREALRPYPDQLKIATKVGHLFHPDGSHSIAAGADMRRLVEENLEELGVERLDLVYLRIGEMEPPHGESIADRFQALARLRDEGLIKHLGLSNIDAGHLEEAVGIAPVAAVQNHFSITRRQDRSLLDACEAQQIAFCPFFPLGGGAKPIDDPRLVAVAEKHAATPAQVALAWLLNLSPVMLVIPGTGSVAHLEENMGAGDVVLDEEDLAVLA
ncbi:aldo/keto reductase [Brevundimonas sp. FT23042]|uniref:aldo/keto reductase n=1 Tax=Brevundimonas sp. FT23042 TaxID=3393749 RepID=UPI003B587321